MMNDYQIIVAFCKNRGIGFENNLPWTLPPDLEHFHELTKNNVVIMGKNTFLSLPKRPLKNRMNIVLTNNKASISSYENVIAVTENELTNTLENFPSQKKFVIGGEKVYKLFLHKCNKIHITYIDKMYDCDTYFPLIGNDFKLVEFSRKIEHVVCENSDEKIPYQYMTYEKKNCLEDTSADHVYKSLVNRILLSGKSRTNRTDTDTLSVFGEHIRFNIEENVPLLTSKRIPWKSCVEELLWFLRGDTDAKILQKKNVHIWDGNSSKTFLEKTGLSYLNEGDCGANYSFQWKHFGASYINCNSEYTNMGFDQISYIENLLKTDPFSRRIFMSAWNPPDLCKTVLPPCHVSVQFYVTDVPKNSKPKLSCHMYQRSCDVFLGLPWNIFSYTVLTYILAMKCNMDPFELIISFGDTHIYNNHIEQIHKQLRNSNLSAPKLILNKDIIHKDYKDLAVTDFEVIGYFPHPSIKGNMAI